MIVVCLLCAQHSQSVRGSRKIVWLYLAVSSLKYWKKSPERLFFFFFRKHVLLFWVDFIFRNLQYSFNSHTRWLSKDLISSFGVWPMCPGPCFLMTQSKILPERWSVLTFVILCLLVPWWLYQWKVHYVIWNMGQGTEASVYKKILHTALINKELF